MQIGVEARLTDKLFHDALVNDNDLTLVYHGECSLMRLTNRFYFGNDSEWFVKFPACDCYYKGGKVMDLLATTPELPNDASFVAKLAGPQGVGKSFVEQYVVRQLRINEKLRVFYLANPKAFLKLMGVEFLPLLLEIVYSIL